MSKIQRLTSWLNDAYATEEGLVQFLGEEEQRMADWLRAQLPVTVRRVLQKD